MKKYLILIFAPGDAHNIYKIWVALCILIQAVCALVPGMLINGSTGLHTTFLYVSLGIVGLSLFITKSAWQRTFAYILAITGLFLGVLYLVLDLTNGGIMIYLLAWSMSVSVGYGREYFSMKWFFSFMSLVLVFFAIDLYFASNTVYTGTEKLFNILSGTFVIATNIYLWAREARMNSNHYSERRQKYEDIATLSGKMSQILVSNDQMEKVFLSMVHEMVPRLDLDCCMIFLSDEQGQLIPVDQLQRFDLSEKSILFDCFRKKEAITVSDTALTNYTSTIPGHSTKSELVVPIYDADRICGVIYGCSSERNYFRDRHFQAFNVIASFCGIKITQNGAIESIRAAERTKAETERYKEMDEMKNRFIANVSHDLKTPLSLIKGPARQIEQLTGNDKIKSLANYITQNSDHLLRIVHQLLQLNRVDKGINELYVVEVDLQKIGQRVMAQYEEQARTKGIALHLHCDPILLKTDLFRFEQIVHNLLGNALRYTRQGSVSLKILNQNEQISIEVKDTGIGIPKEAQNRIFERFFKVDPNNQEGTGIGLSLVQEYVNALEGKIEFTSEVGQGTTFRVMLPKIQAEVSRTMEIDPLPKNQELLGDSLELPHMLVVEDHAGLNEFICEFFEGKYFPVSAFDGNEALQRIAEQMPDIIITDLMMPNRDGKSFVEALRANEIYDHIPIIVLSAKSQLDSKVELYESGVDNFISKPFEIEELAAVVSATLARRKTLRATAREQFLEPLYLADPTQENKGDNLVNQLHDYLLQHLDKGELSVNEVAAALGYGRNRFQKEVKELTGVTPVELIRSMRLQEARKMLKQDPSKNISEVAYAVGFSNLSYFTRSFRQEFDELPSEVQA